VSPGVLAALAAVCVLLLPGARGGRVVLDDRRPRRAAPSYAVGRRAQVVASLVVGAGAALVVGGASGIAVGAVVGAMTAVVLGRLEPAAQRRTREAVERAAPLALDLIAACLASGATVTASVVAAAAAVGGPTELLLREAVSASRLGATPASAWAEVARQPALAGLARAVVRAHDTGARTLSLKVRFNGFQTITRSVTVPSPVDTAHAIVKAVEPLLEAVDPSPGVRLLGVSGTNFGPPAQQLTMDSLFADDAAAPADDREWQAAEETIDAIRSRFGNTAIGPASAVTSKGLRVVRRGAQQWGPDQQPG